jgi:hypothetical protein
MRHCADLFARVVREAIGKQRRSASNIDKANVDRVIAGIHPDIEG